MSSDGQAAYLEGLHERLGLVVASRQDREVARACPFPYSVRDRDGDPVGLGAWIFERLRPNTGHETAPPRGDLRPKSVPGAATRDQAMRGIDDGLPAAVI